jgi:hypothetical protein
VVVRWLTYSPTTTDWCGRAPASGDGYQDWSVVVLQRAGCPRHHARAVMTALCSKKRQRERGVSTFAAPIDTLLPYQGPRRLTNEYDAISVMQHALQNREHQHDAAFGPADMNHALLKAATSHVEWSIDTPALRPARDTRHYWCACSCPALAT